MNILGKVADNMEPAAAKSPNNSSIHQDSDLERISTMLKPHSQSLRT